MKKFKCPWCNKQINISKKNRFYFHVKKCVGIGRTVKSVEAQNKLIESEKEK